MRKRKQLDGYAARQRDLLPIFVPFAWCLRATGCTGIIAHAANLSYRGLPLERHGKLMAWVMREHPALTAARTAVWNSVRREFAKPAEVNSQPTLPLLGPPRPPKLIERRRKTKPRGKIRDA